MVRSYTRHYERCTEFRGSRSCCFTCQKRVTTFQGKRFKGKLSRENFPGKTFQGKTFQEKLSRKNFPGKTFQGRGKAGEGRTENVRWRSRMRRGSLPRASTRSARGLCPHGTAGILRVPGVILGINGVVTARGQGGSDEPARMMSNLRE